MSTSDRLPVRTASEAQSIWKDVKENEFRQSAVALQRASSEVPGNQKDYTKNDWSAHDNHGRESAYLIPFSAEQQIADDFAFIAAAEEAVKAVSAVGLEILDSPPRLNVRLAVNDQLPQAVPTIFRAIFDILGKCARRFLSRSVCIEALFHHVMMLSRKRIHGRLRSAHWQRPKHLRGQPREPLHAQLRMVFRNISLQRPSNVPGAANLRQAIEHLCDSYKRADEYIPGVDEELSLLKIIVKESHALCTSGGKCTIEQTVQAHGFNPDEVCKNKHIRQADKIGRYWGLCTYLVQASRKFPEVFKQMDLRTLPSYEHIYSPISFKGGIVSCHVHAEIQLLVFYGSNNDPKTVPPRVIGVSKAACYLCDLFISKHGKFLVTKTHGRLYDQWTVPDLNSYGPGQRRSYRAVLLAMYVELNRVLHIHAINPHRRFPMTSWVSLKHTLPFSVSPSETEASLPDSKPQLQISPAQRSLVTSNAQTSPTVDPSKVSRDSVDLAGSVKPTIATEPVNIETIALVSTEDLPIERTITAFSFVRAQVGKLHATIEFEGPGEASVIFQHVEILPTPGVEKIDITSLSPEIPMCMTRSDAKPRIVMQLVYSRLHALQVTLQWLQVLLPSPCD